ncbi:MAG: YbjN domain-containing protein [Alphaproteobacteria bacterium]
MNWSAAASTKSLCEVQGKWNNMLLFFAWEANMQCMHLSCLMDIETKIEDRSKIFELLALVNEELWVGHFSYWTEQNMFCIQTLRHT